MYTLLVKSGLLSNKIHFVECDESKKCKQNSELGYT